MELSDKEGELLVRIARSVLERTVQEGRHNLGAGHEELLKALGAAENGIPRFLQSRAGIFVTLNTVNDEKSLRGCIGFPLPYRPMIDSLVEASILSSLEDPRFDPVSSYELDNVVVEVSVLTPPELVKVKSPLEYPSKIMVGSDGLIVKWSRGSGLLLPQVPVELRWNAEEFLSQACVKAGSTPDCWLQEDTMIYKFGAVVFEEGTPRGYIVRKHLQ